MNYRLKQILTTRHREFSRKSLQLGGLLIVMLVVAAFVDLDAMLRYFKFIGGSARTTLETGAIISLATAIPFLAMGMSISDDVRRNE